MTDTGGTTQLPGVTFVGVKPNLGSGGQDDDTGTTRSPRDEIADDTSSPGGWTQAEIDFEVRRLNDCAADKYDKEVTAAGKRGNEVEHFSITFVRDGNILVTDTREATGRHGDLPVGSAVTDIDFNNLSRDNGGIRLRDITGFNHNHPAEIYCDGSGLQLDQQIRDNRRPSENDWDFADMLTGRDPNHPLVLYVRDCGGTVRAFPYAQKAAFLSGSLPTPDPIQPDGCEGTSP